MLVEIVYRMYQMVSNGVKLDLFSNYFTKLSEIINYLRSMFSREK